MFQQAFNQLEIAMHVEMVASMLHHDAMWITQCALAGTATKKCLDVLEAAFGREEPPSVRKELDEEPLDQPEAKDDDKTTTSTLSAALKCKAPLAPTTPQGKPKSITTKSQQGGPLIQNASCYYPTVADKEHPLHAGVEDKYISQRKSSSITKKAGYVCNYAQALKNEGKVVKDCDFFAPNHPQLSTHIRQHHLCIAITCYVCNRKWWAASTWCEHMQNTHKGLSKDDYYLKEGTDVEEL